MKSILLHAIILTLFIHSSAQNFDLIGSEKALSLSGGVSADQVAYFSSDSLSQRDPYSIFLSGNLNMGLYGWNVPLSFGFSNQKFSYTQPFNQYSLHPSYKWIRLHAGYTSMSFSPYTLNGHLFLGGGAELTPEKPFSFSAMAGRLKKAVGADTTALVPIAPVPERWGYGFKGTYTLPAGDVMKTRAGIIFFHASDKPGKDGHIPDSPGSPGENTVVGVNLDVTLKGGWELSAEMASSAVTGNTGSGEEQEVTGGWTRFMSGMVKSNATTQVYSARKMHITYRMKNYSLGAGYEHIDPGYQTFGAYYFSSDMENVTVNGTLALLNNMISLGANAGRQRDNLDGAKASQSGRWVTAFNISYNPAPELSTNVSWSTFNSYTHIRSEFDYINMAGPYDYADTLNFTQLSATASANIIYTMMNTESVRSHLNLNISSQTASEKQGRGAAESGSRFYNAGLVYGHSLVPSGLSLSAAFNVNVNTSPGMRSSTAGPTLTASKMLLNKKLRTTLACAYNKAFTGSGEQNAVLSIRPGATYRIGRYHHFSLSLTFMNRKLYRTGMDIRVSEAVVNGGYRVSF